MEKPNEFEKLENALTVVGRNIAYPKTPTFSADAHDWLVSEQTQRKIWNMPQRVRLTAALVLVVAFAFFMFPESRDAFAQLLGLGSVRVTSTWTPTMTIASTPSPLASLTTGATAFQPSSNLPTQSGTPSTQPSNIGIIDQMRVQTSPSPTRP